MTSHVCTKQLENILLLELPVLPILTRVANREAMNGAPMYAARATDVLQLTSRAVASARAPERSRDFPAGWRSPED
jgi:hypothetical protein